MLKIRLSPSYSFVTAQDQIKALTTAVAANTDAIYVGIACFQWIKIGQIQL